MMNHGKKLRSAITDQTELGVLLLKQVIRLTLLSGRSVSYADRYFLHQSLEDDTYVLSKVEDLAAYVTFFRGQEHLATDFFIEQFFREANCDLDSVLFQTAPDSPGCYWAFLRKRVSINSLLEPEEFEAALHKNINDTLDEEADSTATRSNLDQSEE